MIWVYKQGQNLIQMKRINSILLMISIIFTVISCQNETPKATPTVENKLNQDSIFIQGLTKPINDKIYLLSYKDELNDTIVRKIIIKYLEKYHPIDYYTMTTKETDTTFIIQLLNKLSKPTPVYYMKSLIDTISINYKVSKKKIAQIIFDYRLLQSIEDLNEQDR